MFLDPVIAYFEFDSANVSAEAALSLDEAASLYFSTEGAILFVEGYADTRGSVAANLRTSRRRAEAAARYLVERGVPEDAIEVEAYGETQLRVKTADGVSELQNRRVEVVVVGQAAGSPRP